MVAKYNCMGVYSTPYLFNKLNCCLLKLPISISRIWFITVYYYVTIHYHLDLNSCHFNILLKCKNVDSNYTFKAFSSIKSTVNGYISSIYTFTLSFFLKINHANRKYNSSVKLKHSFFGPSVHNPSEKPKINIVF